MSKLVSPTFLFRYRVPLRRMSKWPAQGFANLTPKHVLPSFGELEGNRLFAELRGGWHANGLAFSLRVAGKKQATWCRAAKPEDSDGLQIWLDTRDTHNVHRATQFCHCFVFLPRGGGRHGDSPCAEQIFIHRARAHPKPAAAQALRLESTVERNGYQLNAIIQADALQGFDTSEHLRLGFFYDVVDRELGNQTFSVGSDFKYQEDPCVWGTLELTS